MRKKDKDDVRDNRSEAQILLGVHCRELGIERIEYERRVCEEREWLFDLAMPDFRIACEIHGGQFTGGHRRGWWNKREAERRKRAGLVDTPQEDEYNKISTAQMLGWRVFQFTNEQVNDGRAKAILDNFFNDQRVIT